VNGLARRLDVLESRTREQLAEENGCTVEDVMVWERCSQQHRHEDAWENLACIVRAMGENHQFSEVEMDRALAEAERYFSEQTP
jgi:hypothetical protein